MYQFKTGYYSANKNQNIAIIPSRLSVNVTHLFFKKRKQQETHVADLFWMEKKKYLIIKN